MVEVFDKFDGNLKIEDFVVMNLRNFGNEKVELVVIVCDFIDVF